MLLVEDDVPIVVRSGANTFRGRALALPTVWAGGTVLRLGARVGFVLPGGGCQAVCVQRRRRPVVVPEDSVNRGGSGRDGAVAAARWRLADRIATALSDRLSFPGWLDEVVVNTRISHAPHLRRVVEEAAEVAASAPAEALAQRQTGHTGLVARLHGPVWSLVFRICGDEDIPVLVLADEMPGQAWRIDADDDWTPELHEMVNAVLDEIERRLYPGG